MTTERISNDWKQGLIIKIPEKGGVTKCKNWRGITLLSVPIKILSRTILNRITDFEENKRVFEEMCRSD
jgi:hypothetical protein